MFPYTTFDNNSVVSLDEICRKERISSIRLIKIDVEGYEIEVFAGAHELLSTIQPDAILFELNERRNNQLSKDPVVKLLQSYGYDFFIIPKSIFRMKLKVLNNEADNRVIGNDILAVQKGAQFDEIVRLVKATV